jgi:hypothetical protein
VLPLAANFPDGSGYVLAAYLVFAALLLVYLGITAYRLLGLEKRLTKLTEEIDVLERERVHDATAREQEEEVKLS